MYYLCLSVFSYYEAVLHSILQIFAFLFENIFFLNLNEVIMQMSDRNVGN